jgi:diguanylate cyclase (GGDEF)-like protein
VEEHQTELLTEKTMECIRAVVPAPESETQSFFLLMMAGPDKGAVFTLSGGPTLLGRSEKCDIILTGRGVSREHASLTLGPGGKVMLEDRGSTNGVFVDGVLVKKRLVEAGETIALGPEVQMRLEVSSLGVQDLLQKMYQSATLDPLTNLFNRRTFEERLDEEFTVLTRHKMESCLALVDVDHFKNVNDTWGHHAGDLVLQVLAARLKESVRTGDLVGRWGGEEFILYIRQSGLDGATSLLERLRSEIEAMPVPLPDGQSLHITISSGVVSLAGFQSWNKAFQCADEALYQSKSNGRNRVTRFSGGADG